MNDKQSGQCKMMFILLKYQCIVCKIDSKTNQKFMSIFFIRQQCFHISMYILMFC